jgi:hypothetical protein
MGKATVGANVAKYFSVRGNWGDQLHRGSVSAFRDDNDGGMYKIHYEDADREFMDTLLVSSNSHTILQRMRKSGKLYTY